MSKWRMRLRNEAVTNPDQDGLPWSSKALDQCLRRGAELIGCLPKLRLDGFDVFKGVGHSGSFYCCAACC